MDFAAAAVSCGMIGCEPDGLLEIKHCQPGMSKIFVGQPPLVVGIRVVRIEEDGFIVVFNGKVILKKVPVDVPAV